MNILDTIVQAKKAAIAAANKIIPEARLRADAFAAVRRERRPFHERFITTAPGQVNIIAEIKRASPSKGDIRLDLDPAALAKAYEKGGAAALSVLTDAPFFKGSLDDLILARKHTTLPVLRKEFIIAPYQLYETVAAGADAVLLIVRILDKVQLQEYLSLCAELDLDALVEIHTEAEIDTAVGAGARLIGINNRNLQSFETDTDTAVRVSRRMGPSQTPVAASGIENRQDIDRGLSAGIHNFLVGESLVRSTDPAAALNTLIRGGDLPPIIRSGC